MTEKEKDLFHVNDILCLYTPTPVKENHWCEKCLKMTMIKLSTHLLSVNPKRYY